MRQEAEKPMITLPGPLDLTLPLQKPPKITAARQIAHSPAPARVSSDGQARDNTIASQVAALGERVTADSFCLPRRD